WPRRAEHPQRGAAQRTLLRHRDAHRHRHRVLPRARGARRPPRSGAPRRSRRPAAARPREAAVGMTEPRAAAMGSAETPRYDLNQPVGRGPFSFPVGYELSISGWAFLDPVAAQLPDAALEIVSHRTGAVTRFEPLRVARPDVAAHFADPRLLMTGFDLTLR